MGFPGGGKKGTGRKVKVPQKQMSHFVADARPILQGIMMESFKKYLKASMNILICFCLIILFKNYFITKTSSKMKACDFYKCIASLICDRGVFKKGKQAKYVYTAKHLQ